MTRHLGLCAALLWLAACSHTRVLEKPLRPLQWSDLWKDQNVRRAALTQFSGKLKLAYQGQGQDVSGKGRIVGRQGGQFRLELRDPIGRLHYVLVDTGSEVRVHYPRERVGVEDSTAGEKYFEKNLGERITFAELAAFFLGLLPEGWDKTTPSAWEWDSDLGFFRGSLQKGADSITVWVDSGHAALRRVVWQRAGRAIEARLDDFSECCDTQGQRRAGFQLAYEVKVLLDGGDSKAQVSWDSLSKPTQPLPSTAFELKFPAGDRVTRY